MSLDADDEFDQTEVLAAGATTLARLAASYELAGFSRVEAVYLIGVVLTATVNRPVTGAHHP